MRALFLWQGLNHQGDEIAMWRLSHPYNDGAEKWNYVMTIVPQTGCRTLVLLVPNGEKKSDAAAPPKKESRRSQLESTHRELLSAIGYRETYI